MSDSSWERVALRSVAKEVESVKPSGPDPITYIDISAVSRETLSIERPQEIPGDSAPSRARQQLKAGDVLFSTVRPNLRTIAVVPEELDGAIGSTGFCVIRGNERVVPGFLFYAVLEQGFQNRVISKARGVSYPAVRDADILNEEILLPPVDEQQAIVAVLRSRLDGVTQARTEVEATSKLMTAQRRALFQLADDEVYPEVLLADLLDRVEAGKSFKCEGRAATEEEWGVIKVSAMTWGEFNASENKALPKEQSFDAAWEIKGGDILISRANTTQLIGASVLVPETVRSRLLLSDKSLRLVPRQGLDRRWLQFALSAPTVRAQISSQATGTSDSMRNISQKKLRDLVLHLPSVEKQQEIADRIDGLVGEVETASANITAVRSLLDAIERSLVTQELRPSQADSRSRVIAENAHALHAVG